jgi:hypothetical protein
VKSNEATHVFGKTYFSFKTELMNFLGDHQENRVFQAIQRVPHEILQSGEKRVIRV